MSGYKEVFWGDELWKQDEYIGPIVRRFDEIDLLSLDVFDTLLLRTCDKPRDVFVLVGEQASQYGFLKPGMSPRGFQQIRVLAEERSRLELKERCGSTEVNLNHIYEAMPASCGDKANLMRLEIEAEKQFCYVNPSVHSMIRHFKRNHKSVVLLSDMYLSSKQIAEILVYNGFDLELVDMILVSNEAGGGKWSGFLFDRLMSCYPNIPRSSVLHIGDNVTADYRKAQEAGMAAVHYDVVPLDMYSKDLSSAYGAEYVRFGPILPEISSLRKLVARTCSHYSEEDRVAFRIGASILGPILSAFADWVIELAHSEKTTLICPLMREGKLLSELIERSASEKGVTVKVSPLFVSRRSTALAGMNGCDENEFEEFFGRGKFNVKELFDFLGVADRGAEFSQYADISLGESDNVATLSGESLKKSIFKCLMREDVRENIQAKIRQARELLVGYLGQACGSLDGIITVDIGFRGTIQASIESAIRNAGVDFRMIHALALASNKTAARLLAGVDIRAYMECEEDFRGAVKVICQRPEPIEELIIGSLGTTLGYEAAEDGLVKPLTAANQLTADELRIKDVCRKGILAYQDFWFYLRRQKTSLVLDSPGKRLEFGQILGRMVDMPTFDEAVLVGGLHHEDNFISGNRFQFCTEEDDAVVKEIGPEKLLKNSRYVSNYRNVYWPQGVVSRNDPSYFLRHYLAINNQGNYFTMMCDLASLIIAEGFKEIVIYGAGEAGKYLLRAASLYKIKVSYVIDSNRSQWGHYLDDVQIVSLDQVIRADKSVFAVGSFAYAKEIRQTISDAFSGTGKTPRIFAVNM